MAKRQCGKELKEARKSAGLTQADATKILGIKMTVYRKWEAGTVSLYDQHLSGIISDFEKNKKEIKK